MCYLKSRFSSMSSFLSYDEWAVKALTTTYYALDYSSVMSSRYTEQYVQTHNEYTHVLCIDTRLCM